MLDIDKGLNKALENFKDNEKFYLFYFINADNLAATNSEDLAEDLYMSICSMFAGYDQGMSEAVELIATLEGDL
jgi:hypothetical protein